MAWGRGSACGSVFFAMALLCLVLNTETARAATYAVGDRRGWTFNVANWPKGKAFKAGDVLVFNYASNAHNVAVVDGKSYNGCTTPKGAKVFQTGKDRVTLRRGLNYYICNFPGHCQGGMKIAVNAA
ncbi:basic blue protein-like [Aristolochia californica]|uniref:basic blue protein-like n=1 Tax=Aristolochia californica TaxID=171875 RepID=UPI0035D66E19